MMEEKLTQGQLGAHNELIAAAWLLRRGYKVFRNVAASGPIDIVGVKDNMSSYFDVKTAYRNADGYLIHQKLSEEQLELGVLCICVLPDGSCEIAPNEFPATACETCGNPIEQGKRWSRRRFCSPKCTKAARGK